MKKIVFIWLLCVIASSSRYPGIEDLRAESDYRSIKLKWRYRSFNGVEGFKVTLCETTSWKVKYPCKQRHLLLNAPRKNSHDFVRRSTLNGGFEASIYELRMLTNYSISVQPILTSGNNEELAKNRALNVESNVITISTKGFSARTTRCLGNVTDIEVTTGPYFPGKIEVEDKFDKRCVTYGDKRSGRRVYKLTIMHDVCGSKTVNDSRIQTSIVVHENRELVTHSSRRFLVVCNFLPGTLTIQAAVQVPRNHSLSTLNSTGAESNYDNAIQSASSSNIRDARLLTQERTASLHQPKIRSENRILDQAAVPIILTISALMGIVIFAWKQFYKQKKSNEASSSITDQLETVDTESDHISSDDAKKQAIN
ncbi:uncharacterized protein LOC111612910 [Centruroides sculpturatus]|uniref:uncharacterized protein LOC111612910 n=1 Tax=Centruroides sculpturatus TaxID=218467 RepID=UPI000C6EFBA4|nr:uncharacterized protein LOC111612910 [Centruroides sculpturatus]